MCIPLEVLNLNNAIASSPETMDEAMRHFAGQCAMSRNDGSREMEIGRSLYSKTPDMRASETQHLSVECSLHVSTADTPFLPMCGYPLSVIRKSTRSLICCSVVSGGRGGIAEFGSPAFIP